MTRIILSILFYVILTPIGLISRLFGKQFVELRWDKSNDSYWNFRSNENLKKVCEDIIEGAIEEKETIVKLYEIND